MWPANSSICNLLTQDEDFAIILYGIHHVRCDNSRQFLAIAKVTEDERKIDTRCEPSHKA